MFSEIDVLKFWWAIQDNFKTTFFRTYIDKFFSLNNLGVFKSSQKLGHYYCFKIMLHGKKEIENRKQFFWYNSNNISQPYATGIYLSTNTLHFAKAEP